MHTAFKKDIIKKIHKTPEENWRRIVINEVRKKIIPELPNRENTFNDLILPQISIWISDSPEIINFMKFLHNIRVKPLLTDDELNEDIMKEFDIIFKIHDLNKAHPEKLEEAKRRGLLGGRKTKRKRKRKGKRTRRRRKKTRRKRKGGKKRKTRRRKIMVGCRKKLI